jgi:hypothetical protein
MLPKIIENKDSGFLSKMLGALKALAAAPSTPLGETSFKAIIPDVAHEEAAMKGLKYLQQHGTPEEVAQYKKVMGLEHFQEKHTASTRKIALDLNELFKLDPMALAAVISAATDSTHLQQTIHALESKLKASPAATLTTDVHSTPSHIPTPGPITAESSSNVSDPNINMAKLSKYLA